MEAKIRFGMNIDPKRRRHAGRDPAGYSAVAACPREQK
jgi:hypothetical protein